MQKHEHEQKAANSGQEEAEEHDGGGRQEEERGRGSGRRGSQNLLREDFEGDELRGFSLPYHTCSAPVSSRERERQGGAEEAVHQRGKEVCQGR